MTEKKSFFPEIQVKKDIREHVLARPDMYLGSCVYDKFKLHIVKDGKVVLDTVEYNPAFERTVIEIGSNCIDNVWRSQQFGVRCTAIRFRYEPDGMLSFRNDGLTIPVQKSTIPELKELYNPSIVFGIFMSSTNYDDNEKRRSSGRNGHGAKVSNAFSKIFTVETQDEVRNLYFTQTWRNNMEIVEQPVIQSKSGKGYTQVSWMPDYARFKMTGLTPMIINRLRMYLYDVAMITKIPIYMNDELIPVRSLIEYAQAFRGENKSDDFLHIVTPTSEVVILPNRPGMTVAFTNGIPNPNGGVHVTTWSRAIFSPLTSKLNEKTEMKGPKLRMEEVQNHFALFIVCSLDNPTFSSQEKTELTAPKPETSFKVSQLNKILKWSIIDKIRDLLDSKLLRAQKKKLEGSRKVFKNIKKLEDANLAGTSRSMECYLLYPEGDSAKTYVVTGIEKGINGKSGRDFFGILPCGGKILNVRNQTAETIAGSSHIQDLIQALGLRLDCDYSIESNMKTLRYGAGLMIVSDADDDGTHIEGLCLNFMHKMFPSLVRRSPPYITSMKTPIVRVQLKDGTEKKFYRQQVFEEFQEAHADLFKGKPKHFKGLGTSNDREVMDSFGERIVHYASDDTVDDEMMKAFGKKKSNIRKDWITDYDPNNVLIIEDEDAKEVQTSYSSFINNDLIHFSIASNDRALPSMIDGLKPSQRKIIYTCFKNKLMHNKPSLKVFRLACDTASATEYIHGEQCLWDAIVGMAWDFVGSNNIPLLDPDGQFGSRCSGGKDAAKARYIMTRLQEITPYIFREEDNPILDYLQGEDITIEPRFYVPVVPLVLINGVRGGIGTGWACKVPAYNPTDILACLRLWIRENLSVLEQSNELIISDLPEIRPWYQGFTGEIDKDKPFRYASKGVLKKTDDITTEISELPIGLSTDTFRETLKKLREQEHIADFSDYCSKTRVKFIIHENAEKLSCSLKNLKMVKYISTNSMVGFTEGGKIHRYSTVDEIIYDFAQVRLKYYQKRKDYLLKTIGEKLLAQSAKRRFVEEVIRGDIVINRKKKADIIEVLTERKYPLVNNDYNYLLKMPVDSFTEDMIHKLDGIVEKLHTELANLEHLTTREMWSKELDEFETAYHKYQQKWAANEAMLNCGKTKMSKPVRKMKRTVKK